MSGRKGALDRRRAGILLHPTSLPGGVGNGDLGPDAYRFVEFLAASGQSVWQTLPVGPTHEDRSPYLALSVHAGNPLLITPDALVELGWLEGDDEGAQGEQAKDPLAWRQCLLERAHRGFHERAPDREHDLLAAFMGEQAHWLDDYALFVALKKDNGGRPWTEWPPALRDRRPPALEAARRSLYRDIDQACFEQFLFFRQWDSLKRYANEHGVRVFGDMPIFVAHDSADVWVYREYFDLDKNGSPRVVAGVPPDYFSATGQRWGNPHYRWRRMQADGFRWWLERVRSQLRLFDLVRIDHFRGFEAYWEISAGSETAVDGRWVEAPGDALFKAMQEALGALPLVAEDLGQITPQVNALRKKYGLPGMKILQFAFDGSADNPYLPHHHEPDSVVYTGTHDNDTTLGWFGQLPPETRQYVLDYLGSPSEPMPWPLVRCAQASVAKLAVIPMQDLLALGGEHRMNRPGTSEGNWLWRFSWDQVPGDLAARMRSMARIYGREG